MVGQVLGAVGALPEIFTELEISYFLLRRLLGVRTEGDKKAAKVCTLFLGLGFFSLLSLLGFISMYIVLVLCSSFVSFLCLSLNLPA